MLMVMLMALVSVGFASCGDDDEPKDSSIVGTWIQYNIDGIESSTIMIQFTKNGIYHEVDTHLEDEHVVSYVYKGKYTVSGNKLTVTYNYHYEDETVNCTYQVKGDQLTITHGGESSTLTRVEDSLIEPYL